MVNSKRLANRIEELAEIGKTKEGGVTRLALTEEYRESVELIKSWMEEAGMQVRLDPAGNLIGRKEGLRNDLEPVVIGSHFDSVSNAGKFDGTIGVIGGIEVVHCLSEQGIKTQRPIEVIGFGEEEAARFGAGLFGSRAMVGAIQQEDLAKQDKDGISRREALIKFGLNPDDIFTQVRKKGDQLVYLEMHIEQGPVLEHREIPVGIVTGITGMSVTEVRISGQANHAGATPMDMRHDALLGASEIALALEEICVNYGPPAVGTVGYMEVSPGESNIVPGQVTISLDIRDLSSERHDAILKEIGERSEIIAQKRGLKIQYVEQMNAAPALSNHEVIEVMKKESEKLNIQYIEMPSGAGHDAQLMATISDMGMIFVRSREGSHNPKEFAAIEDITKGTELLLRTALHYLNC